MAQIAAIIQIPRFHTSVYITVPFMSRTTSHTMSYYDHYHIYIKMILLIRIILYDIMQFHII